MFSELDGMERKVCDEYPKTFLISYTVHGLKLVFLQTMSKIKQCKDFFSKLESISSFFSRSAKRVHILDIKLEKIHSFTHWCGWYQKMEKDMVIY